MGALINGRYFSYASMEVRRNGGAPIVGAKIKYSYKVEEGMVMGPNGPLGRTRGRITFEEATLTVFESEYRALATPGWLDEEHTIAVTYAESDGQPVHADTLQGVRFLGDGGSGAEDGVDAIEHAIPFSMLGILVNGASPIAR